MIKKEELLHVKTQEDNSREKSKNIIKYNINKNKQTTTWRNLNMNLIIKYNKQKTQSEKKYVDKTRNKNQENLPRKVTTAAFVTVATVLTSTCSAIRSSQRKLGIKKQSVTIIAHPILNEKM